MPNSLLLSLVWTAPPQVTQKPSSYTCFVFSGRMLFDSPSKMLNHETECKIIFQILMRCERIWAERTFTPHGYTYLAVLAIPGARPLKRHSVIWRSSAQLGSLCKYFSFPFSGVTKIKEYTIGSQKGLEMLCDINKLLLGWSPCWPPSQGSYYTCKPAPLWRDISVNPVTKSCFSFCQDLNSAKWAKHGSRHWESAQNVVGHQLLIINTCCTGQKRKDRSTRKHQ